MSLGSEILAEYAYERDEAQKKWEHIVLKATVDASHGIWRTRDGRVMLVGEMSTEHIINCIRMLERNSNPLLEIYRPMFEKELAERKDKEE